MRGAGLLFLAACLLAPVAGAEALTASKPATMLRAVEDITLAAANHDMVLVKDQPIDTALQKRGFGDPHVRVLFIGSETAVRWAEAADPLLLNLLPLRLTLVEADGMVTVMTDDFEPWLRDFPEEPAQRLLKAWRVELREVLDDYAWQ
ncbi:MAG: hypothetical protein FD187_2741 [bacterium]|nr:MAG: hypothetical protein FD142_1175 [bacterium]KAF0147440.1 MAG: hypothetical protein FD187_2741 [bacterium]KAF0166298.1 MAG: hypothetical protein FD158_2670 [bacterium]TXT16450.1 MAG: hypothetical protein FD132_2829 [bacterium]